MEKHSTDTTWCVKITEIINVVMRSNVDRLLRRHLLTPEKLFISEIILKFDLFHVFSRLQETF